MQKRRLPQRFRSGPATKNRGAERIPEATNSLGEKDLSKLTVQGFEAGTLELCVLDLKALSCLAQLPASISSVTRFS